MNLWVLAAIGAQACFAAATFVDKVVLSRAGVTPGAAARASGVINIGVGAALVGAFGVERSSARDTLLMLVAGALVYAYLVPYFSALDRDDTSAVVPLLQAVPLFTLLIAWVALGEHPSVRGLFGFPIVLLGAAAFGVGDGAVARRVRLRTVALMMLSSVLIAVQVTVLDYVLAEHSFWNTAPTVALGIGVASMIGALSAPRDAQPLRALRRSAWCGLVTAEVLNLAAEGLIGLALVGGQAAVVALATGAEPLFVLAFGLLLTRLVPSLVSERTNRRALTVKAAGSALVLAGLAVGMG